MVNRFIHVDDCMFALLQVIAATVVSVELERPAWLMVVGPPSSGKTELMDLFRSVRNYHRISILTAKTLFSGSPSARGGLLIREVGAKGILAFPDFTTVTHASTSSRRDIFNHLRVVYDGRAGADSGLPVESGLQWEGRVALIGSTTESIERHKIAMADLGERLLYFQHFPPPAVAPMEIDNSGLRGFKAEASEGAVAFIEEAVRRLPTTQITEQMNADLYRMAQIVARSRAVVYRDGTAREITAVLTPEHPHRVHHALQSLTRSLIAIGSPDPLSLLRHSVLSTLPVRRFELMEQLLGAVDPVPLHVILEMTRLSKVVIRRELEDMTAQDLVTTRFNGQGMPLHYKLHESFEPELQWLMDLQGGVTEKSTSIPVAVPAA
jgi:hypothetical protein